MNGAPNPPAGEGSIIGRFVAILTPFFALGAGWLSGVVAHNVPGAKLGKSEIVAFMVAVATSVLTSAWKWLQGLQHHEEAVANKQVAPLKVRKQSRLPRKQVPNCEAVQQSQVQ